MSDDPFDLPPPSGTPVRIDLPPPYAGPPAGPDGDPAAQLRPSGGSQKRAHSCEICGRRPALKTHARKYTGMVILGRTTFWKGNACKQCATSLYRDGLTHSLWAGWWGLIPIFWNPVVIARDVLGLRRARNVSHPAGDPRAEPLDAGSARAARPAAWVGIVVPLLVIGGLAYAAATLGDDDLVDSISTGTCLSLGDDAKLAPPEDVPCSERHTAEVTGIRDAAAAVDQGKPLCVAETATYLGGPHGVEQVQPSAIRIVKDGKAVSVVCLILSSDGSDLVGSQRGTGR